MTTNSTVPANGESPRFAFRFQLVHVFYAMSLLAAALATSGAAGLPLSLPILGFSA